ncbi:thiamine phosphate synthase [Polaribacter sp. Asnod1-A03]|uniref:thiamine phosphate synthase n=1 Tax=Polaribacter sp. Asnod1-A03 TaxID=3160581 RepID=UPI00386B2AE4
MTIPKLHYISQGSSPKEHIENIQKACSSGAELVQLQLENISDKKYLKFAAEARGITDHFQTRLIIHENYKIASEIKADGVHLGTTTSMLTPARKELYTWQMIGATACNLKDCQTLLKKEVDYISLGSFKSNKENLVLGLNGFTSILEILNTDTPIIGFGNITNHDVKSILETGVSGVAVSEEITQNFDLIKVYHQLLSASSIDEQRHSF